MKLVALTVCCVDFYPQQGRSFLGGNSLNFVAQACKSGSEYQVSLVAAVGNDEYGSRIIEFIGKQSIPTDHIYQIKGATASNQIINDEAGERFGVPGKWENGVYGSFYLSENDWKYVLNHDVIAMPANNPNFEELLKRAQNKHFIVSDFLDVENKILIEKYIQNVQIAQIAAREEMLDYYRNLADKSGTLLIVTLGSKGSVVFYKGKMTRQEAIAVPKVIDTTGCGDSYLAAFSVEYYKSGNITKSMKAGAIAASKVLQHFGGVRE